MKHTEEQILEKAKIVMKDLRGKLYLEGCVDGAFFKEKHNIISGKNEGKVMATWSVSIKAVFDNIDFLTIPRWRGLAVRVCLLKKTNNSWLFSMPRLSGFIDSR